MFFPAQLPICLFFQKIRRILLPLCFIVVNTQGFAQRVIVLPIHPTWGDTLRISYQLPDSFARTGGDEVVYAKVTTRQQDGGYRWYTLVMEGKDRLTQTFVLPAATTSFSIRFYTLHKDDEGAGLNLCVYDRNSQAPVAGAYWEDFFSGDAFPYFEKETKQYPQQWLTYAKYFNVVSMYKGVEDSKRIIDSLMPVLEKAYSALGRAGANLLAALCVGYAKSGQLAKGKTFLLKLFAAYPQSAETALAFNLYNYEYYKATSRQIEEDVRQQLAIIYKQWPDAALTADMNVTYYVSKLPELTVANFERALLPRYQEGMIPYYGLDNLPGIYIDRKEKMDSAKAMLTRFIRLWQEGGIHHQFRLSPGHYRMYMPFLLQKLSTVNLLLQEYGEAVTNASAGMALLAGGNYEGNLLPDLLDIRARAYKLAGNMDMALEDYQQLYKSGKETVLDSIRLIFPFCNVKEKSLDDLLASLRKKSAAPESIVTSSAPAFTGTDLQGRPVKLADLRGKLVLINFWSIGCGPCIGEMPALNKLVQKYKNNEQVVFLAITGDATAGLLQFFKKRTFLYKIVNKAGKVQEDYQIESLPVHIVIGKSGAVINRSTGAREDIESYLDGIIQRNL